MAKKRATIDWRFIRLSGPGRAPRACREDSPAPRVVCTVCRVVSEWCLRAVRATARGVCLSIQNRASVCVVTPGCGRGPCERETESERMYNIF